MVYKYKLALNGSAEPNVSATLAVNHILKTINTEGMLCFPEE